MNGQINNTNNNKKKINATLSTALEIRPLRSIVCVSWCCCCCCRLRWRIKVNTFSMRKWTGLFSVLKMVKIIINAVRSLAFKRSLRSVGNSNISQHTRTHDFQTISSSSPSSSSSRSSAMFSFSLSAYVLLSKYASIYDSFSSFFFQCLSFRSDRFDGHSSGRFIDEIILYGERCIS